MEMQKTTHSGYSTVQYSTVRNNNNQLVLDDILYESEMNNPWAWPPIIIIAKLKIREECKI